MKSIISFVKALFNKKDEGKDCCGHCRYLNPEDCVTVESYAEEADLRDESFFYCEKRKRYVRLDYAICEHYDKLHRQ